MPQGQVAQGSHYQFGAPAALADVLMFKAKGNSGGRVVLTFEAPVATNNLTVSVEVSDDGAAWNATTTAENLVAVTAEVIKPKTARTFEVLLRATTDKWMRIRASGSDRGGVTIKGNEFLDLVNIQDQQGGGFGEG